MIAKVCLFLAAVAGVHAGGLVGVGAPLLGAGHYGLVSAQSTAINHVAPVGYAAPLAYGHGIAATPLAYGQGIAASPLGYGLGVAPLGLGHGLAAGNLRADGLVGHGLLGSRYGGVIGHNAVVGHGIVGGVGHGGLVGLGHGIGLGKAIL